jgi:uncharacterized protein
MTRPGPADPTASGGDSSPADPTASGGDRFARDRDSAGRPRNARPRDALGRPLPYGASGEPVMPDDLTLGPAEAAALADRLLREDRPFHAHEVLEAAWKAAPPDERDLWQGLAQIAVGLTHARRGNATGAVTLLRRGAARVRRHADTGHADTGHADTGQAAHTRQAASTAPSETLPTYGLDLPVVLSRTDSLADRIGNDGLATISPDDLRLPLLAAVG